MLLEDEQDWTMFCCPHCSKLSTILNNIVEPESGVTMLNNIADNYEEHGQQNMVQSRFLINFATTWLFLAMYSELNDTVGQRRCSDYWHKSPNPHVVSQ